MLIAALKLSKTDTRPAYPPPPVVVFDLSENTIGTIITVFSAGPSSAPLLIVQL